MARTTRKGLDYSPWNVNIFDGDQKIDKLLESQGCTGFTVYFYLCQMAYKFEGYFYPWSYDDSATTAKRVGGGVGSEAVRQTVSLCLHLGLFDQRLFDRYGILTSRGIQARFLEATTRRVGNSIVEDYWLLEKESSNGLSFRTLNQNNCSKNSDSCNNKSDFCSNNSTESKGEESKGKESRDGAAAPVSSDPLSPPNSAMAYFMDRINPTPSETVRSELTAFEADLGSEVCIRAMMVAIENHKTKWNYIRGILRNKQADGIRSLAAWEAGESMRERSVSGNDRNGSSGANSVSGEYGVRPDVLL